MPSPAQTGVLSKNQAFDASSIIHSTNFFMTSLFSLPMLRTSSCDTTSAFCCTTGFPASYVGNLRLYQCPFLNLKDHTSASTSPLILLYSLGITTLFVTRLRTMTFIPSSLATRTSGIVLIPTTSAPAARKNRPSAGVS